MPEILVNIKHWLCNRCHWKWMQRGAELPKVCPKCHSAYWNSERKNKDKTKESK